MALQPVLQTRIVNHNNEGELHNVALLTLTNAAVAANEPIRKAEFDSAIAGLSFDNVVESTEASLADYITANGTALSQGTLLYLPNAPERQNRFVRRDYAESNDGTVNDFLNINAVSNFIRTDLTDQYGGADGIFIDDTNGFIGISDGSISSNKLDATFVNTLATKGDATTYTDLGLVEDELQAINTLVTTHSHTEAYSVTWGTPDGQGISTATIDTSADFGTADVQVRIVKDLGDGYFEHISTATIEVSSNATSVRLRTDSGAVIAASLTVFVTGTSVV